MTIQFSEKYKCYVAIECRNGKSVEGFGKNNTEALKSVFEVLVDPQHKEFLE